MLLTLGGSIGSGVVGLLLPQILDSNNEFIWFVVGVVVVTTVSVKNFFLPLHPGRKGRFIYYLCLGVPVAVFLFVTSSEHKILELRNFYGSLYVADREVEYEGEQIQMRYLFNGSINHGQQPQPTSLASFKGSYYGEGS